MIFNGIVDLFLCIVVKYYLMIAESLSTSTKFQGEAKAYLFECTKKAHVLKRSLKKLHFYQKHEK